MSVAKYDFGSVLGRGKFSKVRQAKDIATGAKYAVKIIEKAQIEREKTDRQQLRREISYLKEINHKHIVKFREAFQTKNNFYLVMEIIEGGELFDVVDDHQKGVPEDRARKYFQQLIVALRYLHLKKIAVRDLKLENLMLDKEDNLKIIDLGLAQRIQPNSLMKTICGTPVHIAPELARLFLQYKRASEKAKTEGSALGAGGGIVLVSKSTMGVGSSNSSSTNNNTTNASGSSGLVSPSSSSSASSPSSGSALPSIELGQSSSSSSSSSNSSKQQQSKSQQENLTSPSSVPPHPPPSSGGVVVDNNNMRFTLEPGTVTSGYSGEAVDIYSAGTILFALLSGRHAFDDSSVDVRSLMKEIEKGNYRMSRYIPEGARSLIESMMKRDPKQRATIEQIIQHPWFAKNFNVSELSQGDPVVAASSNNTTTRVTASSSSSASSSFPTTEESFGDFSDFQTVQSGMFSNLTSPRHSVAELSPSNLPQATSFLPSLKPNSLTSPSSSSSSSSPSLFPSGVNNNNKSNINAQEKGSPFLSPRASHLSKHEQPLSLSTSASPTSSSTSSPQSSPLATLSSGNTSPAGAASSSSSSSLSPQSQLPSLTPSPPK